MNRINSPLKLAALVALGLAAGAAILLSRQALVHARAERASLQQQFDALRAETEQTTARLGRLAQRNRQPPSSQVLRLRGEVTRLAREMSELELASPTNSVSPANQARRDQIALETVQQFELRKAARSQQLSSALQALDEIAAQPSEFDFFDADGKPAPALPRLVSDVQWDGLEVLCHDSKTFRFLQRSHPDELVVLVVQPLLDPAGEQIHFAIRANGEILSLPEATFYRQRHASSMRQVDRATLSSEWKQFREGQGR